jgi:hypothetical protein
VDDTGAAEKGDFYLRAGRSRSSARPPRTGASAWSGMQPIEGKRLIRRHYNRTKTVAARGWRQESEAGTTRQTGDCLRGDNDAFRLASLPHKDWTW